MVRRSIDELPPVGDALESIVQRLSEAELVVFLDYDGTLAPIVSRPEDARLSENMREAVARLARQVRVAVVSGRGLSDLRERVGLAGLTYAGSHGFEIAGPGGTALELPEATHALADLDLAERELEEPVTRFEGAAVERKRFSLAVHYRNLREEEVPRLEAEVDRALSLAKRLRKTHGKKVFDLQPDVAWNKGRAVLWMLERLDLAPAVLPVYIGDDLTDEDAFEAVALLGVGVVVGEGVRRTSANYRVPDPDEVERFLRALARVVR
jgi:trehalose-phosphatase